MVGASVVGSTVVSAGASVVGNTIGPTITGAEVVELKNDEMDVPLITCGGIAEDFEEVYKMYVKNV